MMEEFLKSLTQTSVMVIGDIMLDRYLFGEIKRTSTEAPINIVDIIKEKEKIGGAGNVALSLKNLKVKVSLFGFVGNDLAGTKIISEIKKNKINTSGILINGKTTEKTRIITSKRKHHSRFDIEEINYKNSTQKEKLLKIILSNIPNVDFLILQDYNKGLLDKNMIKNILSGAKKYNKPVMVDPKEKNFIKYKGVKLIKPNLKEAEKLLKQKISLTNKKLREACLSIQQKTKSDWVILTLGKNGLCIFFDKQFYREYALPKKEPDVTGAGDNVICTSSLAIFHQIPIQKIAKLSNESGRLACNKIGTNPINYYELITKLKKNTKEK